MKLTINNYETEVASTAELRREMTAFASEAFREIWLTDENGPTLSALMNGNIGWLMYLDSGGDAGFSSRNPAFGGSKTATFEYRLSNGQRDVYPANWALPEERVMRGLEHFLEHRSRAPFIHWHDDSEE